MTMLGFFCAVDLSLMGILRDRVKHSEMRREAPPVIRNAGSLSEVGLEASVAYRDLSPGREVMCRKLKSLFSYDRAASSMSAMGRKRTLAANGGNGSKTNPS